MISVYNYVKNEKTHFTGIVNGFLPREVTIPFDQEYDTPAVPVVVAGDAVSEGQVIASTDTCTVHSSVPGIIKEIYLAQLPNGKECLAAKIKLNGNFSYRGKKLAEQNALLQDKESIIEALARKGIINTFNSNKPVSLSKQLKAPHDFLVVRLFDEDPGSLVDATLANLKFDEIRKAAAALARTISAKGVIFVFSKENIHDPIKHDDDSELFGEIPVQYIKIHAVKYPIGFKRDLCILIKHVISDEQFKKINLHSLYIDALTLVHTYEALFLGMPLINQYVQVTSSCLNCTGVFKICVGTPIQALVELCGGIRRPIKKIIINGIIIGTSVSSFSIPVTAYTKQVIFVPKKEIPDQRQTTCIRCGNCRSVCPRGLYPDMLYNHIARAIDIDEVYLKTANLCSGCALCNAFCPSRLPLTQTIALLKDNTDE